MDQGNAQVIFNPEEYDSAAQTRSGPGEAFFRLSAVSTASDRTPLTVVTYLRCTGLSSPYLLRPLVTATVSP